MSNETPAPAVAGRLDRQVRQPEPLTAPWVVVAPDGVAYVGLHEDEAGAWCVALGWPSEQEIAERKLAGWYAAIATMTWRRSTVDGYGCSDKEKR